MDGFDFDGFGDGDETDIGGVAMGAGAGVGDVVVDAFEVFRDFVFHACRSKFGHGELKGKRARSRIAQCLIVLQRYHKGLGGPRQGWTGDA